MKTHQRLIPRKCLSRLLIPAGFACACPMTVTTLHGQARHGAVQLRAGAAMALTRTSVGGETSTDFTPLLTGQLGAAVSDRTDLVVELAVQPIKAQNPVADEAFTAVYALAGVQLGRGESRRFYFRPELGLVFRSWSGSEVFVDSEIGLAAGLAVGREWPVGAKSGLAIEGFVRFSGADELSTTLLGLGVSLVPVGARPRARRIR